MKETTNFKLNKPENTDTVDITKLNENMDILDTQVQTNKTDILTLKIDVGSVAMTTTDETLKGAVNELNAGKLPTSHDTNDTAHTDIREQIDNLDNLKVTPHLADLVTDADGTHGMKIETGVFTPVIEGSATAGLGTYSTQVGKYVKINKLVLVNLVIVYSAHTGTGNMNIGGLPFIPNSNFSQTIGNLTNITLSANHVATASTYAGVGKIGLTSYPVGGGTVISVPIDTNGGRIDISGFYFID